MTTCAGATAACSDDQTGCAFFAPLLCKSMGEEVVILVAGDEAEEQQPAPVLASKPPGRLTKAGKEAWSVSLGVAFPMTPSMSTCAARGEARALTEGDGAALLKCSHHGSGVMATGFVIALFAVSVGISFRGYGLLLSLLGILTGVALIAVVVRTTDDPTAFGTTMLPDISLITVRLRRNLAVAGLVVASAAIAGITGEASPMLCFSLFATLLVGIALITAGVLGGWTA